MLEVHAIAVLELEFPRSNFGNNMEIETRRLLRVSVY